MQKANITNLPMLHGIDISNIIISEIDYFSVKHSPDVRVGSICGSYIKPTCLPSVNFPTGHFISHHRGRYGYYYSITYDRGRDIRVVLTRRRFVLILVRYATESAEVGRLAFWRHDCPRHARKRRKPCRRRPNDRTTAACCGTHSRARSTIQNNFWRLNANLTASRTKIIYFNRQNVTTGCVHLSYYYGVE